MKNLNSSKFKIFTPLNISKDQLLQKFLFNSFCGQFAKSDTNNAEYFYEYSVWLKAINYFCEKAPSQIFHKVLDKHTDKLPTGIFTINSEQFETFAAEYWEGLDPVEHLWLEMDSRLPALENTRELFLTIL